MSHELAPLYAANVGRPLSVLSSRPARLGYSSIVWAEREDFVAAVSGCGTISVFHVDTPGESCTIINTKRAPPRHLAWRPCGQRPPILAVADAACRITLWVSPDRRANVWVTGAVVEPGASIAAIGWTKDGSAIAAVLVNGAFAMYSVPDVPFMASPRLRTNRLYQQALQNPAVRTGGLRKLSPRNSPTTGDCIFGGPVRVASIMPGSADTGSVTVVVVSCSNPHVLRVWHISVTQPNTVQTSHASNSAHARDANQGSAAYAGFPNDPSKINSYECRTLSGAQLDPEQDGACIACTTAPRKASIYAVGDRGVLSRWFFDRHQSNSQNRWTRQATVQIDAQFPADDALRRTNPCLTPFDAWRCDLNSPRQEPFTDSSRDSLFSNSENPGISHSDNIGRNVQQNSTLPTGKLVTSAVTDCHSAKNSQNMSKLNGTAIGLAQQVSPQSAIDQNPASRLKPIERRKVFSVDVGLNGAFFVTADAFGVTLRDASTLEIVTRQEVLSADGQHVRNYWGICLSPNCSVIVALDGDGRVDVSAILSTHKANSKEVIAESERRARCLFESTSSSGLRGGWDLFVCMAAEGREYVSQALSALSRLPSASTQRSMVVKDKLENIRVMAISATDPEAFPCFAARQLLECASLAIKSSAPPTVASQFSLTSKDFGRVVSHADFMNHLSVVAATSQSANPSQLVSAPLCDWIILLCVVYLRRCVMFVMRNHATHPVVGSQWATVVANDRTHDVAVEHCYFITDKRMADKLRSAAVAAAALLTVNDAHADGDRSPRFLRFSREQTASIVSAFWDVSSACQSATDPATSSAATQNVKQMEQNRHNVYLSTAAALARHPTVADLFASEHAPRVISIERALGLRGSSSGAGFLVSSLRRGSVGKSRRMRSRTRESIPGTSSRAAPGYNSNSLRLSGARAVSGDLGDDSQPASEAAKSGDFSQNGGKAAELAKPGSNGAANPQVLSTDEKELMSERTEWCPYDLVTGRPLPPWAPLRRCVISGLLATEIMEPLPDGTPTPNPVAPWASRWVHESPFGGRWALVPSLDLDRHDLLQPAPMANRLGTTNHAAPPAGAPLQPVKKDQSLMSVNDVYSTMPMPTTANNSGSNAVTHPTVASASSNPGGALQTNPASAILAASANMMNTSQAVGGPPMSQPVSMTAATTARPSTVLGQSSAVEIPNNYNSNSGGPSAASGVAYPSAPQVVGDSSSVGQAPVGTPRGVLSTASSTTDQASTTSRGRKRPASNSRRGGRKRPAPDVRASTPSQLSDQNISQGPSVVGMGGNLGVSPNGGITAANAQSPGVLPGGIMQDAISTDTRSTRTAATNISGGVDQVVGKSGRKPRVKRNANPPTEDNVGSQLQQVTQAGHQFQGLTEIQRAHLSQQQQQLGHQQLGHQLGLPSNLSGSNLPNAAQQSYMGNMPNQVLRPPGQLNPGLVGNQQNAQALGLTGTGHGNMPLNAQPELDPSLPGVFNNLQNGGNGLDDMSAMFGFMGSGSVPNTLGNAGGVSPASQNTGIQRPVSNNGGFPVMPDLNAASPPLGSGGFGTNLSFLGPTGFQGANLNINAINGLQNQALQTGPNNSFPLSTNLNNSQAAAFANTGMADLEAHLEKLSPQITPQQSQAAVEAFKRRAAFQQGNLAQMQSSSVPAPGQANMNLQVPQAVSMGMSGVLGFPGLSQGTNVVHGQRGVPTGPGALTGRDAQQFRPSMQQQIFPGSSSFNDGSDLGPGVEANLVAALAKANASKAVNPVRQASSSSMTAGNNMLLGNANMVNLSVGSHVDAVSGLSGANDNNGLMRSNGVNSAAAAAPPVSVPGTFNGVLRGGIGTGTAAPVVSNRRPPANISSAHVNNAASSNFVKGEGIWRGDLHVCCFGADAHFPCVAVRGIETMKNVIRSAESWPAQFKCEESSRKTFNDVRPHLKDGSALGCVQFSRVDENGTIVMDPKFAMVMKLMQKNQIAFEVDCDISPGVPGKMYVFATKPPHSDFGLFGVLKPVSLGTADSIAMMNSLMGGS